MIINTQNRLLQYTFTTTPENVNKGHHYPLSLQAFATERCNILTAAVVYKARTRDIYSLINSVIKNPLGSVTLHPKGEWVYAQKVCTQLFRQQKLWNSLQQKFLLVKYSPTNSFIPFPENRMLAFRNTIHFRMDFRKSILYMSCRFKFEAGVYILKVEC